MLGLFALLGAYITYLQTFAADDLAKNPLNRRNTDIAAGIVRGDIFDADGEILATINAEGKREYSMGSAAAFVTGYFADELGSTEIERYAGRQLLGIDENLAKLGPIGKLFLPLRGNDVYLTIDGRIQRTIYDAMAGKRGAAVVLDADSGAVLALVSAPGYDPNFVKEEWEAINNDEGRPLLNRALNGLYPPGSTIKPIIAAAALKSGLTDDHEVFECSGSLDVGGGYSIHESHGDVHGRTKLEDAITKSCNVTFGTLAMRLGEQRLMRVFEDFGFKKSGDEEIRYHDANLPADAHLDQGDIAQLGIGQSYLLVSPMTMALAAEAFMNGGKVMRPYLVERVTNIKGKELYTAKSKEYFSVNNDRGEIDKIFGYMKLVVEKGTGRGAFVHGVTVAGKTGTAENPGGQDHGWFIGAADNGKRRIAFAILAENGGSGAESAVPVAQKIIMNM